MKQTKYLILFLILLGGVYSQVAAQSMTACEHFTAAGGDGFLFAAEHSFGPGVFLGVNGEAFAPGDTIVIETSNLYNPDSSFIFQIIPGYVSSPQFGPTEFRYTFSESREVTDVYVDFNLGDLSAVPFGTLLLNYRFHCIPSSGAGGQGVVSAPPDDRLNWQSGDAHIAILYPEGESLSIYIYSTESYIANFVTNQDLLPYTENPPLENTLLRQEEGVAVYILTTGQIQVNLGPDAEGKTYIIRMDDLTGTRLEAEYFDPNE